MEMARYLKDSATKREDCAQVVVKNKKNALSNPRGVHGANIDREGVMRSPVAASPLTELESSKGIDASIVFVLASAKKARRLGDHTVWVRGVGWSSDTPVVEDRDFGWAHYVEQAAFRAYKMAGIGIPASYFDLAEVDDTYSYKELQSIEALKLAKKGKVGKMLSSGVFDRDGRLPVNPSGGSLGVGHLLEATGLHRTLEAVLQLRGEAGRLQIPRAKKALVQSWRGIPTATGAVAVLSNLEWCVDEETCCGCRCGNYPVPTTDAGDPQGAVVRSIKDGLGLCGANSERHSVRGIRLGSGRGRRRPHERRILC